VRDGGRVTLAVGICPLRLTWIARDYAYIEDIQFCDEQVKGPFRTWRHTRRVLPVGAHWCALIDRVEYVLPGGSIVNTLFGSIVRRLLEAVFARRHQRTPAALVSHATN